MSETTCFFPLKEYVFDMLQVVGLQENLTILPIQTLNNGDLTITPILASGTRPVENDEIMQVNSFFQNQLWRPEYIGLSASKLDVFKWDR